MTFIIKQGDTAPAIKAQLLDSDEQPVDLTAVQDVRYFMRDRDQVIVNETMSGGVSVIDAQNGRVQYSWSDGDTDSPGQKISEFTVTYQSGKEETLPNQGYIYVVIEEDVAEQ